MTDNGSDYSRVDWEFVVGNLPSTPGAGSESISEVPHSIGQWKGGDEGQLTTSY